MSVLGPFEVHVWSAALDEDPRVEACLGLLNDDERRRAGRFAFEQLRRRYIIAHGFLRDVLSRYLGVNAAAIAFEVAEHGKPFVPRAEIEFNLSHSGDLAVCAITTRRRIGVDVECIRPVPEMDGIVERFFTEREGEKIDSAADRNRAFFECWTRKEAYIKGVGGGLTIPLTSFDTSGTLNGWTFAEFPPREQCVGAIAVEGEIRPLAFLEWSGCAD